MLLNVSSSFLICNAYDMLVYAVLRTSVLLSIKN